MAESVETRIVELERRLALHERVAEDLSSIVAEQGIDAAALEARAEDARKAFDTYTEEAIAAQVFGVPWYVVDGEPFWGQDRLDFVARALERT